MVTKINVRSKGQMTLPAFARKKLGTDDGAELYIRETPDGFELVSGDKIRDVAAGALAKYAKTHNPDPEEERAWVARKIAENGDKYE